MNKLTPQEAYILLYKGTEMPFSGEYNDFFKKGTYYCKQCDNALFSSEAKFKSGCGWPSFDMCLPEAVKQKLDADGKRIEITCAKCDAHLGHVFFNEGFTPRNTRHCVNSLALKFKEE